MSTSTPPSGRSLTLNAYLSEVAARSSFVRGQLLLHGAGGRGVASNPVVDTRRVFVGGETVDELIESTRRETEPASAFSGGLAAFMNMLPPHAARTARATSAAVSPRASMRKPSMLHSGGEFTSAGGAGGWSLLFADDATPAAAPLPLEPSQSQENHSTSGDAAPETLTHVALAVDAEEVIKSSTPPPAPSAPSILPLLPLSQLPPLPGGVKSGLLSYRALHDASVSAPSRMDAAVAASARVALLPSLSNDRVAASILLRQRLRRADADNDGRVTAAELLGQLSDLAGSTAASSVSASQLGAFLRVARTQRVADSAARGEREDSDAVDVDTVVNWLVDGDGGVTREVDVTVDPAHASKGYSGSGRRRRPVAAPRRRVQPQQPKLVTAPLAAEAAAADALAARVASFRVAWESKHGAPAIKEKMLDGARSSDFRVLRLATGPPPTPRL